jgi:hypothetical protein
MMCGRDALHAASDFDRIAKSRKPFARANAQVLRMAMVDRLASERGGEMIRGHRIGSAGIWLSLTCLGALLAFASLAGTAVLRF